MAMEVHYSQKASNPPPPSLKKYNETKQYLKLENDCQNTHIQHLTAVCVFCEMLLFFFFTWKEFIKFKRLEVPNEFLTRLYHWLSKEWTILLFNNHNIFLI